MHYAVDGYAVVCPRRIKQSAMLHEYSRRLGAKMKDCVAKASSITNCGVHGITENNLETNEIKILLTKQKINIDNSESEKNINPNFIEFLLKKIKKD